jgi:hypothetical protein
VEHYQEASDKFHHLNRASILFEAEDEPQDNSEMAAFYRREIYASSFARFLIGLFWFMWLCAYYAGLVTQQLENGAGTDA